MQPSVIVLDKCTLCELCLTQCSREKLIKQDDKIVVTDNSCIACGHCYAICPHQAIIPEKNDHLENVKKKDFSSESFLNFVKSRRSHRKYKKDSISDELIQKLVEFGQNAPSGTNRQPVQYLFIKSSEQIESLKKRVMKVYKKLQFYANNWFIRNLVGLFDKRAKSKELRIDLNKMMKRYDNGKDPLFFNAPLVVLLSASKKEASMPYDDCIYSLYNMVLGAESLGLSSCINGLVIVALKWDKKLRKQLGFVKGLKPYTCATFGFPFYEYKNYVYKKDAKVTII